MTSDPSLMGRPAMSRDRAASASVVLVLAVVAWVSVILWVRSPSMMDAMPGPVAPTRAVLFGGMWLVMMTAMMLPAITPIVLLFRTVQRSRAARGSLTIPTGVFVSGYLAVWLAAGIVAFLAYALIGTEAEKIGADSRWLPYVGGAIVALAGVYQFTPVKNACLRHCRSPFHFLMHGWGKGRLGAFRTGAGHGLFCLGCCWGIMAVLFVVGLMNLAWMAALSLIITVEKLAPRGVTIARGIGALFLVLGALISFWPGVFTPTGLAMRSSMLMRPQNMRMGGMIHDDAHRAAAGPYLLALSVGPAQPILTLSEGTRTNGPSSEVMLGGGMSQCCYLEVRVVDRAMKTLVTNAQVRVDLEREGGATRMLALARMYGVKAGMTNLHYGANVALSRGVYTVHVRVNATLASFVVRIR